MNWKSVIRFHKKNQLTRRNARQQRAHMMRSVHLHRHARTLSYYIGAQVRLVITNHVQECCFD